MSNVHRNYRESKMSRGKGLNVQGDKRKYQEPPQQIDINDTETIICENCGSASFIQSFFLKRISPLVSPTGKEVNCTNTSIYLW